jgi:hypothetical protein
MDRKSEMDGDLRDEILVRVPKMPPQPAVDRIEARPKGQPQYGLGYLGVVTAGVHGRHERGEDAILVIQVARPGMR